MKRRRFGNEEASEEAGAEGQQGAERQGGGLLTC